MERVVIRALTLVALLVVMTRRRGGPGTARSRAAAVILIVSVGIGFEDQAGTLYAVFNGRERQQYVASP